MDRRSLVALALVAAGCARSAPSASPTAVLSSGALSYTSIADDAVVVAAELRDRFELIAYDRHSRRPRWRRQLGPAQYDIHALASDGDRVWVASADGTVRSFALTDGTPGVAWNLGAAATAVTVADRHLVTGTATGVVCLRRLHDGAMVHCVLAHRGPVTDLAAQGHELVSASATGEVTVWDVPSMRRVRATRVTGSANAVAVSDAGVIAIATSARPLRRTPDIARREARGFPAIDPDSRVIVWAPDGTLEPRLGHRAPVTDVVWSDGHLLSASWDRTVRRWAGPRSRIVARFSYLVHGLAATTGSWVVSAWAPGPTDVATQLFVLPSFSAD